MDFHAFGSIPRQGGADAKGLVIGVREDCKKFSVSVHIASSGTYGVQEPAPGVSSTSSSKHIMQRAA
jgi:hypothetical protein